MYRRHYNRQLGFIIAAASILLLALSPSLYATDTDLWESAAAKIDTGDLAAARDALTQLIKTYPSSPKAPGAQLKLAYIKMKTSPQSDQEIIEAFSLVRTKYPSSPEAADALARIGYVHTKSDAAQAISDFSAFLKSHSEHKLAPGVQQSLARLYLRTNDLSKAEEAFDKVKTMTGASETVVDEAALQSGFVKIMKFYADKDKAHLAAAVDALTAMKSSPRLNTRARADLGIAEALLLQGKALDARDKYRAAVQTYAGNPYFKGFAQYGAAMCSQYARDRVPAIEEYTKFLDSQSGKTLAEKHASWRAVALKSTSANAQLSIEQNGDWDRLPAHDAVQKAAYQCGECLYASARFADAAQLFQSLIQAFPETEVSKQAEAALKRCEMARGGK